MSAAPLLEAVRRAGGAIAVHDGRLRLSAPEPLPDHLLEELRLHKQELIEHLHRAGGPAFGERAARAAGSAAGSESETLAAWAAGVARLAVMRPHRNYPEHAWRLLITDAGRFLEHWGGQAERLGWPTWELFGCHRRAPWGRIQGMGLILLLRGDELAALTETEAAIRTPTGAYQTYRRKPRDPLPPAERCLVWELS